MILKHEDWFRATHYTTEEGGLWIPALGFAMPKDVFSIKTRDGRVWDRVVGWRDEL